MERMVTSHHWPAFHDAHTIRPTTPREIPVIDALRSLRSPTPAARPRLLARPLAWARRVALASVLVAALASEGAAQVPPCQPDLGFQGPGLSSLTVCGGLATGQSFYVQLLNAPSFTPSLLMASLGNMPTPFKGGIVVTVPVQFSVTLITDAAGEFLIWNIPGGGGPVTVYLQCASIDAGQPQGVSISNAVQVQLQA
jgi:hypothetical protein